MGTASTGVRALSRGEGDVAIEISVLIPTFPIRPSPALRVFHGQIPGFSDLPGRTWKAHLEIWPPHSLDIPRLPYRSQGCYCTEPLHVLMPSMGRHSGWQEKHSPSWANSRGSLPWGTQREVTAKFRPSCSYSVMRTPDFMPTKTQAEGWLQSQV